MCGICGILGNGNPEHREPVVRRMMDIIRHRGPDGEGYFSAEGMAFGFRRLAIIDLQGGTQPMHSQDGRYTLVFNGEIYNYIELRQMLIQQGVRFHTFSDTEVLLQMLICKGIDALRELNGMFAFAFFDHVTQDWLLARDHAGIKPLYYTQAGGEFIFASEIKAILAHPNVRAAVNPLGLEEYLTFQFCLDDQTLFQNIYRIEPGQYLQGHGDKLITKQNYHSVIFSVDDYHTEEYFIDRLRYLIEDSIRMQIRSDVPLGAYLSGGIDSSLVTSIAAGQVSKLSAFHGYFTEADRYDESTYARTVAESCKADLFCITPTAEQFVESMPNIIYLMDEPVAGPGVFPQHFVSRLAKEHVTVVLGGQGGDEIFGGYARYLIAYLEQALKGAIFETREEGRYIVTLESIIPNLPLLQQYQPLMQQFWQHGLFESMDARYFRMIDRSPDIDGLLSEDAKAHVNREAVFARFQRIFNRSDTQSYINKMTSFDTKTLLPSLLHVEDRVSMAVSLESRVPLLDYRIMELVASIPPALKFNAGRSKHILKLAARTRLPAPVLERKDKMGFPVPLQEWLRAEPVRGFVHDVLFSRASLERGLFNPAMLTKLFQSEAPFNRQLWGVLCLELWHQQFIDGAGQQAA
jgi:asparagine synthase (glutamine-hydrolysing)